jgi:hypothetical protein
MRVYIDFFDDARGGWRNEVPDATWIHQGVTIARLVVEDSGCPRPGLPRFYVRDLGRRFNSLEEAKAAIVPVPPAKPKRPPPRKAR